MKKTNIIILLSILLCSMSTFAAFNKIDEFQLTTSGSHHGIAYDGSKWNIANIFSNTFRTYDESFNYIGDVPVVGVGEMRALTFDRNSNHLFVGDYSSNIVREVTLAGAVIQQFSVGDRFNALAYDATTDTVWSAHFSGMIEHRTRTGALIGSFDGGQDWTGLAFDEVNNTLICLEDGDTFFEYQTDGTLIGQIIGTDLLDENGQGLAYDSLTGTLWATSQDGSMTVFQDVGRVPEPATMLLLGLGGLLIRRRRS